MKKQKNIIQFTPYFSPHIGGVEKVVEDIFGKWTYGKSFVISGDEQQDIDGHYKKKCSTENIQEVGLYPSFDIVDNFPVPNIWTFQFWRTLSLLKKEIQDSESSSEGQWYIVTHTRFFLSSFVGGLFARFYSIKWIHIEHGSDYVKLSSSWKSKVAYFYDRTIGKWIFKRADRVLAISDACRDFVEREFHRKDIDVWYRGIDVAITETQKQKYITIVFVGRLVHLKGVHILLEAFMRSNIDVSLIIFGNGEERESLQLLSQKLGIIDKVDFRGFVNSSEILDYLSMNSCILVNPSYQEGLPTTVIEALMTKNIVIATDVGGTREISQGEDLLLFSPGNISELTDTILSAKEKYFQIQGKSYEFVKQRFSREMSIENLYNFLD